MEAFYILARKYVFGIGSLPALYTYMYTCISIEKKSPFLCVYMK